jgi:hypothetical protein
MKYLFIQTLNSRPSHFFATNVKRLVFRDRLSIQFAVKVLLKCTGVVDLAIWSLRGAELSSLLYHDFLGPRLLLMDLTVLNCSPDAHITRPFFHLPFFRNLTHFENLSGNGWQKEFEFHLLPSLTHLGFPIYPNFDHDAEMDFSSVPRILSTCKSLIVLAFSLVFGDRPNKYSRLLAFDDPRVVIVVRRNPHNELSFSSRIDWTLAENLVEERRKRGWYFFPIKFAAD